MSAGMGALDRGLVEVGLTAAGAVARVESLETARAEQDIRIGLLLESVAGLYQALIEVTERAGLDAEPLRKAERESRLTVVRQ